MASVSKPRPLEVSMTGAVYSIGGIVLILAGLAIIFFAPFIPYETLSEDPIIQQYSITLVGYVFAILLFIVGIPYVVVGVATLKRKMWGFVGTVVLAFLSASVAMISFLGRVTSEPVVYSVIVLAADSVIIYYFFRSKARSYFSN